MIRIGLFCTTGLSSTILVTKLREKLTDLSEDIQITSQPFSEVLMYGGKCDYILLSPQARFNYEKIKSIFPEKKILIISEKKFVSGDVTEIVEEIKRSKITKK